MIEIEGWWCCLQEMHIVVMAGELGFQPEVRRELWEEIIQEASLQGLVDVMVSEVTLEDIPRVTQAMLGGQTRGRILVRPSEP